MKGWRRAQTFLDTVVTFKSTPTPARAKKPKPVVHLGVTPLNCSIQKTIDHQFTNVSSGLPCVTGTMSKSPSMSTWTF